MPYAGWHYFMAPHCPICPIRPPCSLLMVAETWEGAAKLSTCGQISVTYGHQGAIQVFSMITQCHFGCLTS